MLYRGRRQTRTRQGPDMSPFATPRELITTLRQGSPKARAELERRYCDPVRVLVQEINDRLCLKQNVDQLAGYALRSVEMHLRGQEAAQFDDVSWEVFDWDVGWMAGQMLWDPIPAQRLRRWCPRWL